MVHDLCALILYNKGLDPGLNITMNLWTDSSNMYSFVNCSFTKDRTFPVSSIHINFFELYRY